MKLAAWIGVLGLLLSACGEEPEPVGPPAVTQEARTPSEAVLDAVLWLTNHDPDAIPFYARYAYCEEQFPERCWGSDRSEKQAYVLPHDEEVDDPEDYRIVFFHYQDLEKGSPQEFYYLTFPIYRSDDEEVVVLGDFKYGPMDPGTNDLRKEGEPLWGIPVAE